MHLQRISNSLILLGGLVIFSVGIALIGEAYLVVEHAEKVYVFFWGGIVFCFVSAMLIGGNQKSAPLQRVFALILLSSALYLPIFLRNPDFPLFQDELFHIQTLELMRELKTSEVPITFFPIAGDYPGLQHIGLLTLYTTRLSIYPMIRLLTLLLHVIIPVLAFRVYRTVGLESLTAFYASLFYMANIGYFFFFSTFSYATLGIVLFLFIVMLGLKKSSYKKEDTLNIAILLLLSIPAIIVVHHISSAMVIIYLLLLAVTLSIFGNRSSLGPTIIYAMILWFTWLFYQAQRSLYYLYNSLAPQVTAILDFILKEQNQTHQLFLNSPLPLGERAIAYMYPIILFMLCGLGLYNIFCKKRYIRNQPDFFAVQISFAIFGPVVWFPLGPLIVTNSAEIVYRISPYLFLGVGFHAALFLCKWTEKHGILGQLIRYSSILLVLAGGIIIGDNQAGRFRSNDVHYAAGPEVLTADMVHAADWLEQEYGRFNITVGDLMSSVAFAAFGMQRTDVYPNWTPYYSTNLLTAQEFLDGEDIDYLVVDLRDSQFPPRYRYYFNQAELYDAGLQSTYVNQIFPSHLLRKFNQMPALQRIYDNGDIIIYANQP